jgi:sialic acid synthase SpsE
MVTNVRLFEKVIGDGFQGLSPSEVKATESGRKSIVASRKIMMNQVISRNDLAFKRPGNGIPPNQLNDIVGKTTNTDFEQDDQITMENIK